GWPGQVDPTAVAADPLDQEVHPTIFLVEEQFDETGGGGGPPEFAPRGVDRRVAQTGSVLAAAVQRPVTVRGQSEQGQAEITPLGVHELDVVRLLGQDDRRIAPDLDR